MEIHEEENIIREVERAETVKFIKFPVIMIAIKGYDECTGENTTIYVENAKQPRELIKENLKSFKNSYFYNAY